MLPAIHAAAEEDHREPQDVVREALEQYLEDREWSKIFPYGDAKAKAVGFIEEDIPRLISEAREEHRQGCA